MWRRTLPEKNPAPGAEKADSMRDLPAWAVPAEVDGKEEVRAEAADEAPAASEEVSELEVEPPVYAEWYAWAYRQWEDRLRSHAAAMAGVAATHAGDDLFSAQHKAAEAALSSEAKSLAKTASVRAGQYGEWYWWALDDLKLDSRRAHVAAAVAQHAVDEGARPASAANAARELAKSAEEADAAQAVARPAPTVEPDTASVAEKPVRPAPARRGRLSPRFQRLALGVAGLALAGSLAATGHL